MKKLLFSLLYLMATNIVSMLAQSQYPQSVADALLKAENNRKSLENVLNHYKNDKERYAAACYLIANMPLHAQAGIIDWYDPQVDKIIQQNDSIYYNLIKGKTGDEQECAPLHPILKQTAETSAAVVEALHLQEPRVTEKHLPDITAIKAQFIQQQIDHAFALREQMPRLKQMPLNDFFEYILAYRAIPDYPLVTNSNELYQVFGKYLQADTVRTARCVAERYNRAIWWLGHWGGKYPFDNTLGWKELFFTNTDHDCVDIAHYAAMIFRACGWPAAVEYNTAYKIFAGRHYNLSLPAVDWQNHWHPYKGWQSFSSQTELPTDAGDRFKQCLNLYRLHFSPSKECPNSLKAKDELVPAELESPFIEDVSQFYTQTAVVELPLSQQIPSTYQLAYLASFSPHEGLTAVTWGRIDRKRNTITFNHVVTDNIYFPVYVANNHQLMPFAPPFKLDKTKGDDKLITSTSAYYHALLNGSTPQRVKAKVLRKYPRKPHLLQLAQQSVGTCVIASDNANFANADTLATLSFVPDDVWTDLPLHPSHPYRYYRVCAPKSDPHLHLAEIQFLTLKSRNYTNIIAPSQADTTLYSRLIDEPLEQCKWKAEYDNNYQTAPDQWPDVTLKLSEPQYVDCLHFMIKTADNHVRSQHVYALYQWTNKGWSEVCQGEAHHDSLPILPLQTNTLYWLTDLTSGNEELPFMINNDGTQTFPHEWLLSE